MDNVIRSLRFFLKYWYFRYTLVTELYMVEEWERNFISILFTRLIITFRFTSIKKKYIYIYIYLN